LDITPTIDAMLLTFITYHAVVLFSRYMMFPVHRIMTLKNGGVYVVRPKADCALLRALVDEKAEEKFPAFPFIENLRLAKATLASMVAVSITMEGDYNGPFP